MRFRLALLCALIALAAGAPAAGRPRMQRAIPPPVLANEVSLENRRKTPLINFEIVMPGRDKVPEVVVGKIEKPLASGDATKFPLQGASGCAFEVRWAFEDNIRDAGDIDLCNDAHIVLVD
jgi:hypothetical protein